jgi:hypothetical protein
MSDYDAPLLILRIVTSQEIENWPLKNFTALLTHV